MRFRKSIRKVSDRGRLIREVEKVFREVILKERPDRCEWCGSSGKPLQIAHILAKSTHPRLRFYRDNVLLLCFPCHPPKWHNNPIEAMDFLRGYKGNDHIQGLLAYERCAGKHDKIFLLCLIDSFKKELKKEGKLW
jgi:hypothetical protein